MTETHEATEAAGKHDHRHKIIVNGRERTVEAEELSFEEIIRLAFDPVPTDPDVLFTVTYRHAAGHPHQGMLVAGESVEIKNGTTFNVTPTSKS
ncbi:multiubiquitin domain-containing protein [Nonomuraea sp. CA-141351]|uniref:multiubiquitin domain-containing protein n=1 Tax=Nonomuraea sp. CA-141351 TaxID=3239996 RepID=UPI003D94ECCD